MYQEYDYLPEIDIYQHEPNANVAEDVHEAQQPQYDVPDQHVHHCYPFHRQCHRYYHDHMMGYRNLLAFR